MTESRLVVFATGWGGPFMREEPWAAVEEGGLHDCRVIGCSHHLHDCCSPIRIFVLFKTLEDSTKAVFKKKESWTVLCKFVHSQLGGSWIKN